MLREIIIREYQTTDYGACRVLWGELTQHHADIYGDATIAGDDSGRGFDVYLKRCDRCGMWVAEADGQVVGFAGLLDVVGEEGVAEIEPVVVNASLRGREIGSRLIRRAVSEAKKKNFRFLSIKPELRNEKAFDLYVRLGFNKVGSIELFQDLLPTSDREWKSGIIIHNKELKY